MLTRLLQRCSYPDCTVLTMGNLCIRHDLPVARVFVRGRPWRPDGQDDRSTVGRPALVEVSPSRVLTRAASPPA